VNRKLLRGRPGVLDDAALVNLINAARQRNHVHARRDHALLVLLANVGMRPGEAVRLVREDLHFQGDRSWIRIRRLKKRRARGVIDDLPISVPVAHTLEQYLRRCVPPRPAAPLFPVSVRQTERVFRYYARRAGLPVEAHLYWLRHTAATRLYRSCHDLRLVQAQLGHERLETTSIYAHIDPEQLRRAAAAVSVT
jgi:site-specific recombinase XerD